MNQSQPPRNGDASHNLPGSNPPSKKREPFHFTSDGTCHTADSTPSGNGIRTFISRYVSEWMLWRNSGCDRYLICDIAAFHSAALHAYYFGENPWIETREWLVKEFELGDDFDLFSSGFNGLTDKTLLVLQSLREQREDSPDHEGARFLKQGSSLELLELSSPVEHCLVLGGDSRLHLDPQTHLNGYGCRPFPRQDAITFSSSTASSISNHAFIETEKARRALIKDAIKIGITSAAEDLTDRIRQDILRQFGLAQLGVDIALAASGTDCFLLSQTILRLICPQRIVTIMVGSQESGSGVPMAVRQKHFSMLAALSGNVEKGSSLQGCVNEGEFLDVSLREADQMEIPSDVIDCRVKKLVAENLEASDACVVIHAMDHSKLGRSGPSRELLMDLKKQYGERFQVIVDVCQMRLDPEDLRNYLQSGFIVIVTGSKFFTGPPLSGAILIPPNIKTMFLASKSSFPESINDYCAQFDLPKELRKLQHGRLTSYNLGSYFRWVAALAEMKRYFALPVTWRKKVLDYFCGEALKLLRSRDWLELLDETHIQRAAIPESCGELTDRRMIFPFFLRAGLSPESRVCTHDEMCKIYKMLNMDCSGMFELQNDRDYRILSRKCHIGQPVQLPHPSVQDAAVLRLNVGARVVSENWTGSETPFPNQLLKAELSDFNLVLDKIEILLTKLKNFPATNSKPHAYD